MADHDRAPLITGGADDLRVESDLPQALRAVVGDLRLAHRLGRVAPVAGVDPDELLGQRHDLGLRLAADHVSARMNASNKKAPSRPCRKREVQASL